MGSKTWLYGMSAILGGLMLWPPAGPQSTVSSPIFFLQSIRNEVTVARIFSPLFQIAPIIEVASAAPPAASPNRSAPTTVVVREGQSLRDIAITHGVSVEAIVEANGLSNAELIRPGQRLTIPTGIGARTRRPISRTEIRRPQVRKGRAPGQRQQPASGWVVVRHGQTLSEIADQHRTSIRALVDANGLRSAHSIRMGQRLLIPGRTTGSGGRLASAMLPAARSQTAVVRVTGFLWPARGVLTSRFGWRWRRHHNGIDIAAPHGTAIRSAKAGRVIFSGWYYGYGRAVIMDHGNGLTSMYAHASKLIVRIGQVVKAGDVIAKVGSTGVSTGPHLHFEIRIRGKAVNPLKYL
jgi:murein DD-endopeptidase MepM/ murein hydrolase activator NlpD